jgi:hypothetical protein
MCPFYRTAVVTVERRRKKRDGGAARLPPMPADWCAHVYSPVTRHVATLIVGGPAKLKCAGQLEACQVLASRRPKM